MADLTDPLHPRRARPPVHRSRRGPAASVRLAPVQEQTPIQRQVDWIKRRLNTWATKIFAIYGQPVFLVGSALTEKWPRDIDVRVWLPDEEYAARYNNWGDQSETLQWSDQRKKWSEEMGKTNSIACRMSQLNIDFQVLSMSEVIKMGYDRKPRLRLDGITQVSDKQLPVQH